MHAWYTQLLIRYRPMLAIHQQYVVIEFSISPKVIYVAYLISVRNISGLLWWFYDVLGNNFRFCNMFISHESAHYYILKQNAQMLLQAVVVSISSFSKFRLLLYRRRHPFFRILSLISRWMMMFTIKRV